MTQIEMFPDIENTSSEDLQDGWSLVKLELIADILDSQREPINADERSKRIEELKENDLYPYYGATGQVGWIDDFIFDEELVLLGEDGAPFFDYSKPIAYLIKGKSWVNNHAHVLRAKDSTTNKYILHALNIFDFHGFVTGTTRLKLNQSRMKEITIPLAPYNEQIRIVEKIEQLFTILDAGVEALERLQKNLERYKASVLKAACEGKLVPQNPDDEPASELLERILIERRERWEETYEYARYTSKGKKPPKDWKDRYKEPVEPDTSDLPDLPEGWVWATFEQILHILKNGYFGGRPDGNDDGIAILTIGSVRPMKVDLSEHKYISDYEEKMDDYILRENDLLFVRYNGNVKYVGACGMVRGLSHELLYPDKLIRAQLVNDDLTYPHYLEIYFTTTVPREIIEFQVVSSAGQNGVSGTTLKALPIALPPTSQQQSIVDQVEKYLSIISSLLIIVESSLKRSDRLRQAILKKAFSGELVPQDPNDEPASELLKRIQSEEDS